MHRDLTRYDLTDARSFTVSNHGQYSVPKRRRKFKRMLLRINLKREVRILDKLDKINS